MNCYQCGCTLSEHDFCTNCGADVALYKRIIYISNRFYNDGLERAGVRDLTGAITSLRQSLKFNKNNVEARNLLGLVYFETGEVVAALSEWVISKNMRPKKNIADDYINMIQTNQNRLDTINQTIKKYNQALTYCNQESLDLAVIQLKKVLSLNPKFIRAHQLLALLYINSEEWERAKKELGKCLEIDTNNTATLRYLKEVDEMLLPEEGVKNSSKKKKSEEIVKYQSGNETIIQPMNVRDMSPLMTILNLIIGVAIGALITWFLIIPTVRQNAVSDARKAELEANNELTTRTQELNGLNEEIEQLKAQIKNMEGESEDTQKIITNYEQMITVCYEYSQQNIQAAGDGMEKIDPALLGVQAKSVYDKMNGLVDEQYMAAVYEQAEQDYNSRNFAAAVTGLEKVVQADEDHDDGYAIYHLAHSYRQTGDVENAKKYYQRMIELHPGTQRARASQQYLDELNSQQPQ